MERLSLDKLPRKVLSKIELDTAFMASRIIIAAERENPILIGERGSEQKLKNFLSLNIF